MKSRLLNIHVFTLFIVITVFSIRCKKFLDVNENLNSPTKVSIKTLLPTAQVSMAKSLALGYGLATDLAVYSHQMTTREDADQYGVGASEFYLKQAWNEMFTVTLPNLDVIINQGTEEDNLALVGMAKILKAYSYSQFVDVFGDLPFKEYNKFKEGISQPKFDDDATIYPELIKMIDDGIANLSSTTSKNLTKAGASDLIYAGNTTKWIKAGNTIKLKLFVQQRNIKNVASEVTQLLGSPEKLINSVSESFMVPFGPLGSTDDRSPSFGDYTATQRSYHVSPWLYEIMKGKNPNMNAGIVDPRIPYYIYNQLKSATASENPTEYRDGAFVSIYFGSRGVDRDHNNQNGVSLFGIFPVGGKFDDGSGGKASAESGTGAAPYRMVTFADRLYLEAELMDAKIVAGDAKAVLKKAMKESFVMVDYVIEEHVKPAQQIPILDSVAVTPYINAVLAKYEAGSPNKKTEYIMTQKWLSNIGSAVDQYTDYRRTGFPVLFNPKDPNFAPGGFVQPPLNGNPAFPGAQKAVPVTLSVQFPLSLPWSQTELELNKNAPKQKLVASYKVFWMP